MGVLLLFLLVLYLLVPIQQLFFSEASGDTNPNLPAATAGIALVLLGCWAVLRFGNLAPSRIHLVGGAVGFLMTGLGLLRFYWTGEPQNATIALVLFGTAAVFLSPRWLFAVWVIALGGWGWIASTRMEPEPLRYAIMYLAPTVLAASLGFTLRLRQARIAMDAAVEKAQAAQNAKQEQERLKLSVDGTQDGLWHWDLKTNRFRVSPAWELLLGYTPGELTTNPDEWFNRVHPGYLSALRLKLSDHIAGKTPQFRHEHRIMRQDGSYCWVQARGAVVRDSKGEALVLAGSHSDITSLIKIEKSLLDDTFQDRLTSLPNRHFFMAQLEICVDKLRRNPGAATSQFAVLFLDLNKFKLVNDTLGHLIGDQLLTAVAGRLRNCTGKDDMVSRFAGDEFVVLLTEIRRPEEAINTARRIAAALAEPYNLGGQEVRSGASVGIVLSRESQDAEELVHMADAAMYRAKAIPLSAKAPDRVCVYERGMTAEADRAQALQLDLTNAVKDGQLELHYQPVFSLMTGKVRGVEALLRWRRTEHGLLAPSEFIPIAEKSGLIHEIGEWALDAACRQGAEWQRSGFNPMKIGVNLSARQLEQKDFPDTVKRILERTKLESRWLELELTETALMDSIEHAPATLAQLSATGIQTSIDDFGTGYSSLSYLRRFDFQTLKMDRCFVSDIATDRRAASLARGMISMAHNLDLAVVAEGVELPEQLQFLAAERCDHMQGFLAGRPVPAGQLTNVLRTGNVGTLFNSAPFGYDAKPILSSPSQFGTKGDGLKLKSNPRKAADEQDGFRGDLKQLITLR